MKRSHGAVALVAFLLLLALSRHMAAQTIPGFTIKLLNFPAFATAMAAGPDGNLWLVDGSRHLVGRLNVATGDFASFPTANSIFLSPSAITAGSDGNLWFTEPNAIGRITPSGAITEFSTAAAGLSGGSQIISAPDGNLWFSDGSKLGKITPQGVVSAVPVPTSSIASSNGFTVVGKLAAGPDGNVWLLSLKSIFRITPAGAAAEFPLPVHLPANQSEALELTSGPDGNLWFTESSPSNNIGRITPSGVVTEYAVPTPQARSRGITAGPDGNIWFVEAGTSKIGQVVLGPQVTILEASAIFSDLADIVFLSATGTPGSITAERTQSTTSLCPPLSAVIRRSSSGLANLLDLFFPPPDKCTDLEADGHNGRIVAMFAVCKVKSEAGLDPALNVQLNLVFPEGTIVGDISTKGFDSCSQPLDSPLLVQCKAARMDLGSQSYAFIKLSRVAGGVAEVSCTSDTPERFPPDNRATFTNQGPLVPAFPPVAPPPAKRGPQ